jgi:ATP-binding cassette subfamily B protein
MKRFWQMHGLLKTVSFLTPLQTIKAEQEKTIVAGNRSFMSNVVFWGSMSEVVRNFIWPISILMNVYLFIHGKIDIAALTTFLTAVVLFTTYVWEIIWSTSQFSLLLARSEEAHSYLFGNVNIMKQPASTKPDIVVPSFEHALAFKQIAFAYPDKKEVQVLQNINLTVKKGEKVGIVGKSGSGKTTLTKLLLDYYSIDTGQIVLDGQAVTTQQISSVVSYVPQDTALFHRTIAENIGYATDREIDREAVISAAKQANADEFIQHIDQGYDALVGERGVKLSAGQRQRIAIARAFLDDKPILILDEATSALDSESEVLVQEGLEKLWNHKTVIAIAHRLSTLRHMDRILVMDKGQIIEQGTHHELLKKSGVYANLWKHQSGGFLEE